jgi:phospholipid-binding lipoprotein MlaA
MNLTAVALALTTVNGAPGAPPNPVVILSAETPSHAVPAQAPQPADLPTPSAPTSVDATATTDPAPLPVPATAAPDAAPILPLSLPAEAGAPAQPPVQLPAQPIDPDAVATDDSAASSDEDDLHEIIVGGSFEATPGDPLEQLNAESFEIVQAIDGAVVEPVAKAYNKGLPKPVRQGLRNFFSNLDEPFVFAAFLLQLKPHSAVKTAARFAINSTLGLAGIIDVAKRKPFDLPYRPNGLANTLGYYGVGPGPYFYLPLIGPTTLRDLLGDTVEVIVQPLAIGGVFTDPVVTGSATVLDQLGERAAFDERINKIRKDDDPYATYRDLYLKQRQAEIDALHGRVTSDVVPVYGPGLRAADNKADKQKVDAPVEVEVEPAEVRPAEVEPLDIEPAEPAPAPVTSEQGATEVVPAD